MLRFCCVGFVALVYLRHCALQLLGRDGLPGDHALAKPCSLAFGELA